MWSDGWDGIVRVLVVGPLAYVALVALLRVSGKRTLSKMNAFDLVITVALGSTLASIITSSGIALVEGVLALAFLVVAQLAVTFLSVRSRAVLRFVKASPALLCYRGELRHDVMRRERITEQEIFAALRQQGRAELSREVAVVLETDGSLSVLSHGDEDAPGTSLRHVPAVPG